MQMGISRDETGEHSLMSQPSPPDSSQLLGMTMQENAQNDNAPVVLATDTYFPGDPINPVADTAGNPHIYLPTSAFIYLSSSTADRNKLQSYKVLYNTENSVHLSEILITGIFFRITEL